LQGHLSTEEEALLGELVEAAREADRRGLVLSSSGNFSVRLGEDRLAITASRACLGMLRREDLVVLDLQPETAASSTPGGTAAPSRVEPGRRPSAETPMHRLVYAEQPRAGCILHFQSPAATALACGAGPLPDLAFIPEIPVYIRKIGDAPYFPPGSEALARAVAEAFRDGDVRLVQLRNHGQVVIGDTPAQVLERGTFFELAARICLLAEGPRPLRRFSPAEMKTLLSYRKDKDER
jgi:ribulose-5-phosphate 4-epimerase/fuculose-1-phosphate aldolase